MSHQAPPPPATRRPQQQQTSRGGRRQQHQPQRSSSHQQPALPPPHAHHGGSRGQAVSQARLELTPLQSFSTYTPGAHAEMIYRGLASCLQFLIDDTLMTYIARAAHYTRLESYDSARSIYSDVLAWLEDADALCPYADAPSEVAKPASTTSQAAAAMAKAKQVHQWVSDFTLASRIELRAVLQDNLAYLRELEASTCPSRQQKAPSYLTGYRTASNEQRFFPFRRHAAHPKDKSEREYYMDALRHYWGGSVWRQFNHLYEQYVKRMVGDLGTSFLEDFRRHDRKGITPEDLSRTENFGGVPVGTIRAILQIWCSKGSATTDDGHQFRPLEPPLSEAQEQQKLQRAQEAKRQDEYAAQVLPAQARFGAVPSGGAAVDTSASYLRLIGPQPTLAALQQQEQVTVTTAQPPSFASLMQPPARSAAVRPPPAPAAAPILNQQPTKPNWMQQHTMNVGRPQAKEPLGAPLQPLHALPPPPVLHPPQRSIPETDFIPTKQYQAMQQQQRELVAQQAMRQPMGAGAAIVPRLQMATPAKKPIAAATTAASTAAAAWRALGPSPAKSSAARRKVESVPEVASVLDAYKKKAISPKRRREATTKQEGKKDSLEPEAKRQQLSEDLSPSPILIEPPNAPKLHPSTSTSASDEQPHASSSTDMPHAAAQSIVSSTYSDLIMSDDEDFVSPFIPLPSLPAPPPVLQPIMSQEDADASPLQLQKHPRRAKQRDIFGDDDSEEAKSVSSGSDDEESTPEAKAMTQKSKDEKPKQKLFDIEDEASIDEEGRLSYGQMFRQSSSKTSAATAAAATSRKRKSPEKAQAAGVFSKKDEMAEQLKKRRTEGGGEEKSSSAHSHAAAAGFSKRDTPHEDDEKPWFEDDPKHPFKCFVRVTLKPPSSIVLPIDQTATKKLKSNKQNLTSAAPAAPAATSRPTLSLPAAPSAETFTSMQFKSKEEAIAAKQQFDAARKAAAAMAAAMPAPTAASAAKVSAPLTAPPLVKITAPLKATAGAAAPRIEAPLKPPNSSAHVPANKTSAAPSLPSLPSAKLSATSVASSHLAGPSTAVSLPSPAPSDEFELKEHDVANARTGQLERVFVFVRTKRTWEREGKRLASRDETIEKDQAEALGSAKKRNARGGSSSKAGKAEPKPNATVK